MIYDDRLRELQQFAVQDNGYMKRIRAVYYALLSGEFRLVWGQTGGDKYLILIPSGDVWVTPEQTNTITVLSNTDWTVV